MKIFFITALILAGIFQIYTTMSTGRTETQPYTVIRSVKLIEIRYYPAATMARISSASKSYRDLGYSGFGKLAKYIFGGNSEQKKIAMTSPVHMDIGDSLSTMAFVMPADYKKENLPKPNDETVVIETSAPEYAAVIEFGGFANNASIEKHKTILEKALKEEGLRYHGNFRYLGYNPPYQLFGRRNEVIVSLDDSNFEKQP
jgi:SOUL heme-binding protein